MQPFKVKITLASPLFMDSEYPIHLDALLAYASVQEMERAGEDDCWAKTDQHMSDFLARTDGKDWVWKTSKLIVAASSDIMLSNQIRKSDPEMYFKDLYTEDTPDGVWVSGFLKNGNVRGIDPETFGIKTASGQQRGYQWLTASRWVRDITAYGVGDIDAIEYYLTQHIKYIGKVGRNGYGRVASIDVSSHDREDDWRLRVLPLDEPGKAGFSYATVQACIRPPYWRKTDRVMSKELIA
ncbi:MAG: hypothetical protein Q7K26_01640 [bacterium]|nr:hypothetical protein [bacterium]